MLVSRRCDHSGCDRSSCCASHATAGVARSASRTDNSGARREARREDCACEQIERIPTRSREPRQEVRHGTEHQERPRQANYRPSTHGECISVMFVPFRCYFCPEKGRPSVRGVSLPFPELHVTNRGT